MRAADKKARIQSSRADLLEAKRGVSCPFPFYYSLLFYCHIMK